MWAFVNFLIWPSLKIVLGQAPGDPQAQLAARANVKRYARLNLVLALPVTFLMVAENWMRAPVITMSKSSMLVTPCCVAMKSPSAWR